MFLVATFYKFVPLESCETLQRSLHALCDTLEIQGTILLAEEGINATVAGQEASIRQLVDWLKQDARLTDLVVKYSPAPVSPFHRTKIKVKREIVTLGQPEANPTEQVGIYVSPAEWNQVISDPDVVLVDARNDYEYRVGTFKGAVNPQTESFRQLPQYLMTHLNPEEHKKVAMFCTGGIRCEKATAYLLKQGFEMVYHLQGGILKYLEEVPEAESLWEGECFVFDERITVKHGLILGSYDLCRACGNPISLADKASAAYQPGISCPYCWPIMTPEKLAKQKMRKLQHDQKQGSLL